ncbi:MAG TPA: hypothetical protein VIU12_01995 [Chryseolinea sp.]
MGNTASKEKSEKISPQNKGRKIYIAKHVWYYENDPFDKEKTEAAKQLLKNLDFSQILDDKSVSEQQASQRDFES